MNCKTLFTGMLLVAAASAVKADIKLPAVFSDNMVFQREVKAPVWGWADAGEKVKITASWGEDEEVTAGTDGKWSTKIKTPKAGGPFTVKFEGKNSFELKNVMSGDVWVGSGQSNMQWNVNNSVNGKEEVAAANYPNIRLFSVRLVPSKTPLEDTAGSKWVVCEPSSVGNFSAAAYFFGRKLYKELNIPIGLINTSWGGTSVEAWTPASAQADDAVAKSQIDGYEKRALTYTEEEAKKKLAEEKAKYDADKKKYDEAVAALKPGEKKPNAPRAPRLEVHPHKNQNYPSNLYNGMICPILPFAIKGAIWYQGEHNSGQPNLYKDKLVKMVKSWRAAWGQGDFPFYAVQLPNFMTAWTSPAEPTANWALMREAFAQAAAELKNSGIAVTIEIGEADDIHPKNKQDVGDRLGRLALKETYDMDKVVTSPLFKSCKFKDGKAIVRFDNGGAPLAIKGDKLEGFALVDENMKTVKAEAVITDEDTVTVFSKEISKPVMVYYAWANNPVGVNLINKEGLPAGPFRFGSIPEKNFLTDLLPDEAKKYKLVYTLNPLAVQLKDGNTQIVYKEDNSSKISSFKKIAYFLAVQDKDGKISYVFVSMDAFTDDVKKIGVPVKGTDAVFQQNVANVSVKTNSSAIKSGDFADGCNIEFWPCNYGPGNEANVPGASKDLYDFGDQKDLNKSPGYGCMQIHNFKEQQSILCFNNFGAGSRADVGIGNWDGKSRDWTFSGSASNYSRGELKILVLE